MTAAALDTRVARLETKLGELEVTLERAVQRTQDATTAGDWLRELDGQLAALEQRRAAREQAARRLLENRPARPKRCPDCGGAEGSHFPDCDTADGDTEGRNP